MFFFRKLFGLFFIGLLIFGLFGFIGRGGNGRTQSAYQQGFMDGQQSAVSGKEAAPESAEGTSPVAPSGIPGANLYHRGHGIFFPGFGLFVCLVPFFLMGLLFMAFGKGRWHGQHHKRGPWGHHGRGRGPCGRGPWGYREEAEDSSQEKSPEDIDDGPDGPTMRA